MATKKITTIALLVTVVVIVQIGTQLTGTSYYLTQLTMTMYSCLLIIGLCLVMGYAGQISLGHAGFFAIGGYTSASLTTLNVLPSLESGSSCVHLLNSFGLLTASTSMYGDPLLRIHPWIAFVVAITLTALIAFALGIPVLKLKGHYLAMATLGFGIIIFRIVLAMAFFGEADGISDVPGFTLLPGLTVTGNIEERIVNYYIAAAVLISGFVLLLNLIDSRVGRALRAIHGAEDAADAMGINTARYKLYTFVLSAVFAAIAGVLLTHYTGGISPSDAGVMKSVRYVAIVAIGGMASLWGALAMGGVLNFLSLRGLFGSYDDAVFGAILIIIMLFAPEGVLRLSLWSTLKRFKVER